MLDNLPEPGPGTIPGDLYDAFWEHDPSLDEDDPVFRETWAALVAACDRHGVNPAIVRGQAPACEAMYDQLCAELDKPLLRRMMERAA